MNLSVIRQKGESQNGGKKKTNHAEFSEKRTFLTPEYFVKCAYQGVRNAHFRKIWRVLFLVISVLRLPYYQ